MSKFDEGDINSTERGTCARANGGKVSFSIVPLHLLYGCSRVFVWGALKYAQWNWAKGGKWSTAFDCLMRHMIKWWFFGEECDQESGLHHLDHAMCNLLFLIHYKDTHKAGDDRPNQWVAHFQESLGNFSARFSPERHFPGYVDGEEVATDMNTFIS
ncbi:MAG: dATP/dGTP diphosphohydrolase domain-containing protein [Patescibacteria group bacterium]